MRNCDKRGIVLAMVTGIIIAVMILSLVLLNVVLSHSRLTHHQVSRIQAQYAAKAGVIYALDKLRRNDNVVCWSDSGSYTRRMQRTGAGCDVIEPNLPSSVSYVDITVGTPGAGVAGTRTVSAQAVFTYTP